MEPAPNPVRAAPGAVVARLRRRRETGAEAVDCISNRKTSPEAALCPEAATQEHGRSDRRSRTSPTPSLATFGTVGLWWTYRPGSCIGRACTTHGGGNRPGGVPA